eukprot:gene13317-biopygen8012
MPAPHPRQPKPKIAYSPRHARAMPAPRPRHCTVPPWSSWRCCRTFTGHVGCACFFPTAVPRAQNIELRSSQPYRVGDPTLRGPTGIHPSGDEPLRGAAVEGGFVVSVVLFVHSPATIETSAHQQLGPSNVGPGRVPSATEDWCPEWPCVLRVLVAPAAPHFH